MLFNVLLCIWYLYNTAEDDRSNHSSGAVGREEVHPPVVPDPLTDAHPMVSRYSNPSLLYEIIQTQCLNLLLPGVIIAVCI